MPLVSSASSVRFLITGAVLEGGLGILALIVGPLVGVHPLELVHVTGSAVLWSLLATLPMVAVMMAVTQIRFRPFRRIVWTVRVRLLPLLRNARTLDLVLIAILAGWSEELLFRGVIQSSIGAVVPGPAGPWVGIAVGAVVFGALHYVTFTYAVLATILGFYLGFLFYVFDNLFVAILSHAIYDTVAFMVIVPHRGGSSRERSK